MRNLFGYSSKKNEQVIRSENKLNINNAASNINLKTGNDNSSQLFRSSPSLEVSSEIIIMALEVICEGFDSGSLPPKISPLTKSSSEVTKLSERIIKGEVSRRTFEALEDIDKIWYELHTVYRI